MEFRRVLFRSGDEVADLQAPSLYTSHGAGDVRVYADRAVLARAQRRTWLAGGVVVGIALVLAWLSQRWLQRRVVHPLRQLRDQVGEQRGAGHASRTHELDDLRQGIEALRRRMDEANHSRSVEHTSEIQSLMRIPYAVFCL